MLGCRAIHSAKLLFALLAYKLIHMQNVQSDLADTGYTKVIRTTGIFNCLFIKNKNYRDVLIGGYRRMFDKRVKKKMTDEKQYP